jgi:isoleucyl-tRNA synthetase
MTEPSKKEKTHDYSNTLFLPQTDFPMRAGLPEREPEILKRWEQIDLYGKIRAQAEGRTKLTLHDGPPYANGHIHIGTALNKILKDITVRSIQMAGYECNYVPGWDCHGLPIEWKIEEEYRAKGKNKDEVPIVEFRRQCRAFAERWLDIQREEFKRLGGMGDWAHPYVTMDFSSEARIAAELMKFAMSGQLYRGSKPVMWSITERTALAEAEVEYKEHTSTTLFVKFPVKESDAQFAGASVVIWTTTPWTLPANRAIAFSKAIEYGLYEVTQADLPQDNWIKRGDKLILAKTLAENTFKIARVSAEGFRLVCDFKPAQNNIICSHPLAKLDSYYNFPVPLLAGDFVTGDMGAGFVHIAPGHGADDYNLWISNRLGAVPNTVQPDGSYFDHVALFGRARVYDDKGKEGDANARVIEALQKTNAIIARGRLRHQYPHSWRSKTPIIFRNTPQWFIAMDKDLGDDLGDHTTLRARALKAIGQTKWLPEISQNRITGMIKDRPDWVVSRQRAWGVPITVFVEKESGEILQDKAINARIIDAFEKEGADAWFKEGAAKRFWPDFDPEKWDMVTDVLDVWFDSGCTHVFTLEGRKDLKVTRPPEGKDRVIYFEGSDQHRGWFQSSLLESCGTRARAPYDIVLTHGFVMDQNGEKMSKSKGNTVAPQDVIKQSGADILRLWVASSDYMEDLRLGPEIIKTAVESYRKLRNTLRWMLGSLAHYKASESVAFSKMPELERYMLAELAQLHDKLLHAYENYDYKRVVVLLSQFMITDLSAFYFDVRKDALYCDAISSLRRKAALSVVEILFSYLARYLAPILSFTSEEAWLARYLESENSVHLQPFPKIPGEWQNKDLQAKWEQVRQIRKVITGALEIERVAKRIGSSLEAAPDIYLQDKNLARLVADIDFAEVGITSAANVIIGAAPAGAFTLPDVSGVGVQFKPALGKKCARSWRIVQDVGSDPAFPDVSARDAIALREWHAQASAA